MAAIMSPKLLAVMLILLPCLACIGFTAEQHQPHFPRDFQGMFHRKPLHLHTNLSSQLSSLHTPSCQKLQGTQWNLIGSTNVGYKEGSSWRMEQLLTILQYIGVNVEYQYVVGNPDLSFKTEAPILAMQYNPTWYPAPEIFTANSSKHFRIAFSDDVHCERIVMQRGVRALQDVEIQSVCEDEARLYQTVDLWVLVVPQDRIAVMHHYGSPKQSPVMLPMIPEMHCSPNDFHQRSGILFVGSNHYLNQVGMMWFTEHVYPIVVSKIPNITLKVLGRIRSDLLPKHPSVEKVGLVQDAAMHRFFSHTRLSIAPILNFTGVSTKVLAAIEHCVPVVTTPSVQRGFFKGPPASPVVVARDANEFAEMVVRLHENENEWLRAQQDEVTWSQDLTKSFSHHLDRFCVACATMKQ